MLPMESPYLSPMPRNLLMFLPVLPAVLGALFLLFYLITLPDDPLAKKERVTAEDLAVMIGGGSPPALKKVQ